jgi:hypothetical protein
VLDRRIDMRAFFLSVLIMASLLARPALAGDEPGSRWLRRAAEPELSPLQRTAYTQLASAHLCYLAQLDHWETVQVLSWHEDSQEPMDVLYRLGLDVLPVLAEALEDGTPTRTTTVGRMGKSVKVWKVNELLALLTLRITDRDFAVGECPHDVRLREIGSHPELVPRFRESLLSWYRRSGKKTLSERKIEDVNDPVLQNRLRAMKWIGEHEVVEGAQVLVERIDGILAGGEVNTSLDTELATCALALGQLGDRAATEPVQRVCEHLSCSVFNAYGAPEEGELQLGPAELDRLFQAYHGYSLLGHGEAARDRLNELGIRYSGPMEATTRSEYERRLAVTRGW